MSGLAARARRYLGDAARGIERAPVEVALALYIAVTYSYAIEAGEEAMAVWLESTVTALLVLAFAWTGTLLHALGAWRARTRWAVTLAGAVLVGGYAALVLDFTKNAEAWRAAGLLAAAVLWLIALPAFAARAAPVARLRLVDARILLRLIAVVLYGLALFAGLALALAAIDTLFELQLEGQIYGHVFGWIHFVLVPWVVFGGLEDYVRPAAGPSAVGSAVQRLALYLVPPLLTLYFLILYAYMVRIALTGEVPKNLVSPMVLAACALTTLALLLFDPQPGAGALARALRLAPALLLPLVPLGAWALLLRLGQYGWTEFRALRLVLLAAFTGLALGATVQLVRRRPFALHVAPVALAVILLLAVLGPWSVLPLSRRSQQQRLEIALAQVERIPLDTTTAARGRIELAPGAARALLRGAQPVVPAGPVRTVPAALYDQVQADARYLHAHFGAAALPSALVRFAGRDERWVDFAGSLGLLRAPDASPEGNRAVYRRLPKELPVRVRGGTLYRVEYQWQDPRQPAPPAAVSADSLRLILRLPAALLTADLAPLLASPAGTRGELPAEASVVPVRDAGGAAVGELVVLEVSVGGEPGRRGLRHVLGTLLLPDSIGH